MNKVLDILDSMEEIRQNAAERPQDYPVDYTIRLFQGLVAGAFGCKSREQWTAELKELPESRYYARYHGDASQFHS